MLEDKTSIDTSDESTQDFASLFSGFLQQDVSENQAPIENKPLEPAGSSGTDSWGAHLSSPDNPIDLQQPLDTPVKPPEPIDLQQPTHISANPPEEPVEEIPNQEIAIPSHSLSPNDEQAECSSTKPASHAKLDEPHSGTKEQKSISPTNTSKRKKWKIVSCAAIGIFTIIVIVIVVIHNQSIAQKLNEVLQIEREILSQYPECSKSESIRKTLNGTEPSSVYVMKGSSYESTTSSTVAYQSHLIKLQSISDYCRAEKIQKEAEVKAAVIV